MTLLYEYPRLGANCGQDSEVCITHPSYRYAKVLDVRNQIIPEFAVKHIQAEIDRQHRINDLKLRRSLLPTTVKLKYTPGGGNFWLEKYTTASGLSEMMAHFIQREINHQQRINDALRSKG